MIRSRRRLVLLAGVSGLSLLSCGREVTGPGDGIGYGRNRIAALALAPQFPVLPGVHAISEVVPFTQVRITLRRTDGTIAKDTLVNFPAGVDSVTLAIDVPLPITAPDSGVTLGLSLAYVNATGDTVFSGGPVPVTARPSGSSGSSQTVSIDVAWVPPPGVPLPSSVTLTPATGNAVAGTTTTFVATARDGQGQPLAGVPVFFTSIDTTRARVAAPGGGLVTWRAVRGPARIVATLPNLVSDTATFDISLPASRLLPVSGSAQSATLNTALAAPIVLRVTASDTVPVAGIPVSFAVTTGGGSLLASADTSDASGLVQFSWTLGSLVGAQSVTATLSTNTVTLVTTATGVAPVSTQLAFTASPTTAIAGAAFSAVTVEVRDAGGARTPLFAGPVALTLDAGATGATLAGTTTVNAVAGIATFADLSIQRAAAGLTLIATSAGLTADTSNALSITAAAAANLANVSGSGQSSPISTALASPFVVRIADAFTNPVAGVTVNWAIGVGGGSLSAPTSVTDAAGQASVTYTTGTAAGTSIVTGTVAGLTGSPASFSTTVGAGAATALVFTTSPSGSFVAGTTMSDIVVQARDAGANLAAAYAGNVVLRINTGPGANGDSLVVAAVGGVATFSGVDFGDAGSYTLRADAAGLTAAISGPFDIFAGPPSAITILSGNTQTGAISAALADSLVFRLTDSLGNPVANTGWTIAVTSGGGSVSPAGGNTNAAGEIRVQWTLGATLGAQSISAFVTATPAVAVTANATATAGGGATQLVITQQPGNTTSGASIPSILVEARNAGGSLATGFTGNIEVVVDSGPVLGWSMGGTQVIAATAGSATFGTVTLDRASQYRLRFRSPGLDSAISTPFLVTAGAPARIAAVEGDDETAPAGTALADSLGARVEDAFGNPIGGATVTWSVVSGGGSISPTASVTGTDGIARARWTLGGVIGSQDAQASSAGFTDGFTATASLSDANVIWTGAVNANWSNGGNWSGGVVPTASDSVRIANAGTSPVLDVPAFVARLRVDAGATLQLDTLPILIGGTLDVDPTAVVLADSTGVLALIGTAGTVRGPMPRLYVQSGAYALNGALAVASDLIVSGGALAIGANAASVGGLFSTTGSGTFSMSGPGTLVVQGDAFFAGGSTAGQLTGGVLTVRGDFTQGGGSPQAFSASPAHTVVLDGPTTQSITLLTPDLTLTTACAASCFGTLRSVRGAGSGALRIASNLKALGIIDVSGDSLDAAGQGLISAGTPSLVSDVVVARFVAWQDALIRTGGTFAVDSLVAWGSGALILGEIIPTIVSGAYTITGPHPAPVIIEVGGSLSVAGAATIGGGTGPALTTRGNGRVIMQDTGDTLTVNGDADFGGATVTGLMTAGVLRIAGDFVMSNESVDAFIAEGAHATRLFASNPTARFSRIGGNRFADLFIDATGAMTFDGDATIAGNVTVGATTSVVGGGLITIGGNLIDSLGTRWQTTATVFDANDPIIPRQFTGSVVFNNGIGLDTTLFVGGNLEVRGGSLDLNGLAATVSGDFEVRETGVLRMASPSDTLIVVGNATFRGGSSSGQLDAGYLELRGDFQQTTNAAAFAAGPAHETWFVSPANATVTFTNPGSGAAASHFGTLYLAQPSGAFVLASDVYVDGLLENGAIVTGSQVTGTGQRLVSRGADFSNLQFNNVRWQLLDGAALNAIDSLRFVGMDPASIAFEVVRSGGTIAIPDLAFSGAVPTTGRYLRVEDSDGAAGGVLTIDLTLISPPTPGGYLEVVNGAVVNGWGAAGFSWTGGAASSDWNTPANWSGGVVPSASDSVFVPGALAFNPSIPGGTTLRAFVSARTEGPLAASGTLTITERLSVPTVGGLTCAGTLSFANPSTPMQARGRVTCFTRLVDGTLTVTDSLGIFGNDLQVEGTSLLDLGSGVLSVDGQFSTLGTARVRMQDDSSHLSLSSGASFGGGSTAGLLTAGLLEIGGNFTQSGDVESFSASGTHLTDFRASGQQQLSFANPGFGAGTSHLANFMLSSATSGDTLRLNSDLYASGQLRNGIGNNGLIYSASGAALLTGGASLASATLDGVRWEIRDGAPVDGLSGIAFINQSAAVPQFSVVRTTGTVTGDNLNFTVTPTTGVYVLVDDPDGAAGGSSVLALSSMDPPGHGGFIAELNTATIVGWGVTGAFVWSGNADTDWNNTANWVDGIVPGVGDSVTISAAAVNGPVLGAPASLLAIVNQSSTATLTLTQPVTIFRTLVTRYENAGVSCTGPATLTILTTSTTATAQGRIACDLEVGGDGPTLLSDSLLVERGVRVSATAQLNANGRMMRVADSLVTETGGRLVMTSASSLVEVLGHARFSGGSTQGLLSAGLLLLRGNLTQNGSAEAFAASGTHETQFTTEGVQTISMANASTVIGGASHFNHLRIAQAASSRIDLLTGVAAIGQLRESMASSAVFRASSEVFLEAGGAALSGVRFDNVLLVLRDGASIDLLQNLTFDSTAASATPFRVLRSGGTSTLDGPTFGVVPNAAPGVYVIVADQATVDGDSLTLNVVNPTPAAHGGLVFVVGGGRIVGWPSSAAAAWTGALNSDWSNVGNWSGGIVPDFSTDVTIPVTANPPVISDQRRVRGLTVANGATLTLSANDTLTATGNVVVNGTIAGSTPNDSSIVLRMATPDNITLAAAGTIATKLVIANGGVALVDSVRVTGDSTGGVAVVGGLLNLNGNRMNVTGSFSTLTSGRLQMQLPGDSLVVDENIFFDGGDTEGFLTDGTIIAARDFVQQNSSGTNAFAATSNHLVRFVGSTYPSMVNLVSSGPTVSRFANVALDKALPQAVRFFNTPIQIANLVSITGPVIVENGDVEVSGTVVQPGANGTWAVDATSTVLLSGVTPSTCDGFTFVVTGTPANFTPTSCWNPPANELAWTGGGGNSLWSDPANWSLGRIPVATDSVVIDLSATIDLNAAATVRWLIMGLSSTPTLNLNSGATLQVDSAAITTAGTTVNMVGGATLTGDGGVSIGGQFNWNGGTMSGGGATVLATGSTASIATSQPVTLDARPLGIGGTATLGTGTITGVNAPAITVLATGVLEFDATRSYTIGTGSIDLINTGTLRKTAAAQRVIIEWPITNTGTIEVVDDTLDVQGALNHLAGTISILGGATLLSRGETTAGGAVAIGTGGLMQLQSGGIGGIVNNGNHSFSPGSSITGSGRLRIISADSTFILGALDIDSLVVQNGQTFFSSATDTMFVNNGAYLGGGFIRGTGVVGIRGTFSTNTGNLNGTGTFAVLPGGTFDLGTALRGWTIDAAGGTLLWGDRDLSFEIEPISGIYASVLVGSGGVFQIAHGAVGRELFGTGSATPPNNVITVLAGGTVRKTSGTAISNIRPRVVVSGLFQAQSGTINVQGTCAVTGGTSSGTVTGNCAFP